MISPEYVIFKGVLQLTCPTISTDCKDSGTVVKWPQAFFQQLPHLTNVCLFVGWLVYCCQKADQVFGCWVNLSFSFIGTQFAKCIFLQGNTF